MQAMTDACNAVRKNMSSTYCMNAKHTRKKAVMPRDVSKHPQQAATSNTEDGLGRRHGGKATGTQNRVRSGKTPSTCKKNGQVRAHKTKEEGAQKKGSSVGIAGFPKGAPGKYAAIGFWNGAFMLLITAEEPKSGELRHSASKVRMSKNTKRSEVHAPRNTLDNDNDTLREVPHPSNEGLALQARVKGS